MASRYTGRLDHPISPRCLKIDTHHHFFAKTVLKLAPEFAHGTATFDVGFTGFFPMTPEDHLEFMDRNGIQTAVLVGYVPFLKLTRLQ